MKKYIFVCFINLSWIFLGYLIFVSSIKGSIVFSSKTKRVIQYIFPEGWGFFTKNPKEGLLDIYQIDNNNNYKEISIKNTNLDNNLGFSRISRVKGYELSMIISDIPPEMWKNDKLFNFPKYVKDTLYVIKTKDKFQYFNKGVFLLIQKQPVPWAWSSSNQATYVPIKAIKIKIN